MNITHESVERLVESVRRSYIPDSPTHDTFHLARVAALAARLCSTEGGDSMITTCAAWLHDLHREARPDGGAFFVSPEEMDERATSLLEEAGIPHSTYPPILAAVHYTDRYSFSDRGMYSASIEARCLRDADNLDALGAIGIARAFSFGGSHDIPLFDDDVSVDASIFLQGQRPASTLHHFHEKLLRLSTDLETDTAIQLARTRQRYMEQFVRQFMTEWQEDFRFAGVTVGMR